MSSRTHAPISLEIDLKPSLGFSRVLEQLFSNNVDGFYVKCMLIVF